jgi:hypothetical protein
MADTLSHDDEAYGALTEEEKSKLKEIQGRLDFNNSNTVLQYGAGLSDLPRKRGHGCDMRGGTGGRQRTSMGGLPPVPGDMLKQDRHFKD